MIKTIKIIGLIATLFLIIVGWFFKKGGGLFLSKAAAGTFLPLIIIFLAVLLLLYFMGKPSKKPGIISSFDTVSIYPKHKRRRVWISCTWGKNEGGLFVDTFSKTKAFFPKEEIKKVVITSGYIYVQGLNSNWEIQTDNQFEKTEEIKHLIKRPSKG